MKTTSTAQHNTKLPVFALVGRVNVGKSTLFNRLIEESKAIVSDIPGTTRTSNEGLVLWRGRHIKLIDTGGLTFEEGVLFEDEILEQSQKAMKEADGIVFVVDAKTGPLPQEFELAKDLRKKTHKPVLLVANKVDNSRIAQSLLSDPGWYKLAMGEPYPISAASGRNLGDFLDKLYDLVDLSEPEEELIEPSSNKQDMSRPIQISIIGKPNVGKSSLFNKLVNEEKVIVSDKEHTTREPHDTLIMYKYEQTDEVIDKNGEKTTQTTENEQAMNFIDTAGIRRKSSVNGFLEKEGIHKSIQALDDSDIILFVLDGSEPITNQDMQLGGLLERRSKSVIILVNKWDLSAENSDEKQREVKKFVYNHFPHLDFAQILFVSGLSGFSVHKVFSTIMRVWRSRHTKIGVKALEKFLETVTREHRPARGKGTRHPKLMGIRQVNVAPPIFEIFVKYRTSLHRSYINYLENRLREYYDFYGTPIVIKLTKMKRS